jgi:hypothetical protein
MEFQHPQWLAIKRVLRKMKQVPVAAGGADNPRRGTVAMDGQLLSLTQLDPFQKWSIICAAILTIVYAVMRPLRKRKDPLSRPPNSLSLASQREVEKQMTELLVELEQMARQMTAQLDTRAAKLEMLIKEADARLESLRQATAGPTTAAPAQGVSPTHDAQDSRYAEVYLLAEQGHTPRQIAQIMGRPYGEIELILALQAKNRPMPLLARA